MTTGSCRGCAGRELDAFIILGKVCAPAVLAPKALRASKEFAVLVMVVHLRSWEGGPEELHLGNAFKVTALFTINAFNN